MSPHGLHNAIIQAIGNLPANTHQIRCPHCQQMYEADMMPHYTHASFGVVWEGCYGCLATAYYRMQHPQPTAVPTEAIQALIHARTCITQGGSTKEIDAVCAEIDRIVGGWTP